MSGLVVTNAHVVEAAVERQHADRRRASKAPLRVVLQDGRSFDGEVVSIDRQGNCSEDSGTPLNGHLILTPILGSSKPSKNPDLKHRYQTMSLTQFHFRCKWS